MSSISQNRTVTVIGASGVMGSRLCRRLLGAGYTVHTFDSVHRNSTTSSEPLLICHKTLNDAVAPSDVVILAVPYAAELLLAEQLTTQIGHRIVVSITNPLTPTLDDVVTPPGESAAEHLCMLMPEARLVKAFNTLSAAAFDVSPQEGHQFDTFIASDDAEAAHVVEQIITDMGFRPWYVGCLKHSRTLERMSALLIGISQRYELDGALGWHVVQAKL